jgi:hypothetical protein
MSSLIDNFTTLEVEALIRTAAQVVGGGDHEEDNLSFYQIGVSARAHHIVAQLDYEESETP